MGDKLALLDTSILIEFFRKTDKRNSRFYELSDTRNLIDSADLFIAATAINNNLSLATLNNKHFDRILNLKLVS